MSISIDSDPLCCSHTTIWFFLLIKFYKRHTENKCFFIFRSISIGVSFRPRSVWSFYFLLYFFYLFTWFYFKRPNIQFDQIMFIIDRNVLNSRKADIYIHTPIYILLKMYDFFFHFSNIEAGILNAYNTEIEILLT